ncbi:MAG: hypothetical protein H6603_01600 [Flavobacteriales bacterium]|nr:hypothetical protein [Flavobacteriales bacterium]MCB9203645.1 hypothetical protein [Flavobacteriales bacterium]
MKRLFPLLLILISFSAFAQSPEAFNYQAVVRDGSGNILANQNVGFRIAILQGSQTGTIVYQESHALTTNGFGLANMVVGTGTVLNGNFSNINWGNGPYFVQTAIDPSGGNAYAIMGTAQLVSVPYALYAKNVPTNLSELNNDAGFVTSANDADSNPTNEIQTLTLNGTTLSISDGNAVTLPSGGGSGNTLDMAYDQGGAGLGRSITVDAGEVQMTTASANGNALKLINNNTGTALVAQTTNASTQFSAIQAQTNSSSTAASAVVGSTSGAAWAVTGQAEANSTAQSAVYGSNLRTNGGHGVQGIGFNGVVGETDYSQGNAVFGENYDAIAPLGNGIGVAGTGYYGVVGEDRYLGGQAGANGVFSNGNFTATGTKNFTIDHPTDPANKFLRHFSSESNEVLNIYRGNVTFDANGEALVEMPDYYDLINKNPSYQLTPIGGYMQLFIKEKLENDRFVIGGGTPGAEASWTVYAERNDPYLQQYPFHRDVEVEKREGQKGTYLMPQLYGEGMDKKMIQTSGKTEVEQPNVNVNR